MTYPEQSDAWSKSQVWRASIASLRRDPGTPGSLPPLTFHPPSASIRFVPRAERRSGRRSHDAQNDAQNDAQDSPSIAAISAGGAEIASWRLAMMMLHSAVIGTISNGCSTCGEGERRGEHLHAGRDLERLLHPPGHPLPRCPRRCTQSTRPRGQSRSATSRPRARGARSRSTARGCAPACNEGGHQWQSVALGGTRWQSVAIS